MPAEETFTPHSLLDKTNPHQGPVTLKITSPLFYAHIARCASIPEYIDAALSNPDPKTATFHTSHPHLLIQLLKKDSAPVSPPKLSPPVLLQSNPTTHATPPHWLPISLLRRHPSALSDLDVHAAHLSQTDRAHKARAYRTAVFKLLLSDYVAFGIPALLDGAVWIVRIWLCWLCVWSFDRFVEMCDDDRWRRQVTAFEMGKVALGVLGVHAWWGLGHVLFS